MFKDAKPIAKYYADCKAKGMTWLEIQSHLTRIDYIQAPYGDWMLYRDDNGNLWEDYYSIGD